MLPDEPASMTTTLVCGRCGKIMVCVWKDRPRDGPVPDEPIQCRCKKHVEADPI